MMNGGYKIIDLKDKNFIIGGSGITVPGIYEKIESNNRKVILLSGITISDVEKPDRFVTFGIESGDYVAVISISGYADVLKITVTSDDLITFANA